MGAMVQTGQWDGEAAVMWVKEGSWASACMPGSSEGKGPAREHERWGHRETKLGVKDWAAAGEGCRKFKGDSLKFGQTLQFTWFLHKLWR